ncbi:YgaP family membrane protein [Deinococcus radiophilus]|uniref:YgaP family membrane protein n=1 Tax=Deinococcus radiophilus TaxID=32062 RepID=UPI00360A71BE
MQRNMETTEQSLRSVVGGACWPLHWSPLARPDWACWALGGLMLGTASTGHCPAYVAPNVDARKEPKG